MEWSNLDRSAADRGHRRIRLHRRAETVRARRVAHSSSHDAACPGGAPRRCYQHGLRWPGHWPSTRHRPAHRFEASPARPVARYVDEWIIGLTNITETVHTIHALQRASDEPAACALLPPERP